MQSKPLQDIAESIGDNSEMGFIQDKISCLLDDNKSDLLSVNPIINYSASDKSIGNDSVMTPSNSEDKRDGNREKPYTPHEVSMLNSKLRTLAQSPDIFAISKCN